MKIASVGWSLFVLTAGLGCRTPSSLWNGAWRLDASRSSFRGAVIMISISTDGEYRYNIGDSGFSFRCDGKDRAVGENHTEACVNSSSTTLDLIRKDDGVETNRHHWELSTDGRVFTSTTTALRPNGPVVTAHIIASRISGTNGFAGQWRDTSYLQKYAAMELRLDRGTLHIGYPIAGEYIDASIDGADAIVHGSGHPEGMSYELRAVGRLEFLIMTKRNGTVLTKGSLELSPDGHVITDTWWNPDQQNGKNSYVYERK